MIAYRILDIRAHLAALREIWELQQQRSGLLMALTWRDLTDRYAGQALGATWAVLSPVLTILTYLLAFGLIFKGRLGPVDDGSAYITYMLAGLMPWLVIQDCLSRAPTAVTSQANLVKQIVFPSELLPLRVALSSLPTLLIGLTLLLPLAIWSNTWSPFGLLVKLPLAIILLAIMLAGLSFWIAAIGVFARDLKDLVSSLLAMGLFLHPVLYPPTSIPAWLEPFFIASPLSYVIWCFRDAVMVSTSDHHMSWIIFAAFSVFSLTTGWRIFRMLKPTFGNAL
jgi:lipopolysaccharide transport system permease protein